MLSEDTEIELEIRRTIFRILASLQTAEDQALEAAQAVWDEWEIMQAGQAADEHQDQEDDTWNTGSELR